MFDGYDDPILEIGASFDEEQKTMPTDKFAWFYKVSCSNMTRVEVSRGASQRNGTSWADGQLRMHTGEGDISRLGDIVTWNGNLYIELSESCFYGLLHAYCVVR